MNLKQLLNEINFGSQAAFDAYKEKHKVRDTTKVNIAGKETTAGAASKKSDSVSKPKGGASASSKKVEPKKAEEPKKEEPKSEPAKKRPGNPTVNKAAKKNAEEFGITPNKLGNDGYKKAMYQAAVEALTDANFHDEARELIASIEGKPEWAKKVDYPSMDDPKYKEKMADIRKNGVDSSEYWGGEDDTHEYARKVAASSGWNGVEAADGIAFTLRMNGFHKEADKIQSVFDNKGYMKKESLSLKGVMEAKSDYEVYHKSYTSAIEAARAYAEKKGYEINNDDAFTKIGMGPRKPSEGKTNRFDIELSKDGKVQKKKLQIQVYGMKNSYELNAYIQ
jgi:hypothetical protein